jgi:peptidyl-prolyl cis-trans isomerase SurA
MKRKKTVLHLLLVILCCIYTSPGFSQEVLDRIVAVVGNEVILLSELHENMIITTQQLDLSLEDSTQAESLKKEILEGMVEEKVILQRAKVEGIEIAEEELNNEVENDMNRVISRFNNREEFEIALAAQGLDMYSYREQLTKEKEKQMIQQKFIQGSKMPLVRVSREEAEEYFDENYKDKSLKPATVRLREIAIEIASFDSVTLEVREKVEETLNRIELGEEFSAVSSEMSQDELTKDKGGDLGFVKEVDLLPAISRAISNLLPGEVSRPVKTVLGIHLFKVIERQGNQIHLQHILFKTGTSENPFEETMELAKELVSRIKSGEDFAEIAEEYSTDEETKAKKGDRGEESIEGLSALYAAVVNEMEVGDLSDPFVAEDQIVIVKLEEKAPVRPYQFDEIRDQLIEGLAQEKSFKKFLEDLEKKTYINIRL